ncbi:MAG: DpnII family type II restriction endonuclease, partial [Anaerolineaceae bacterium]
PDSDSISNLKQFLKKDEKFLGVLLALTNLSQEKFLRIISAERFAKEDFGAEWGAKYIYKKLNKDDEFAESIAKLFIEGRDNQLLIQQVADFYLEQLSLPANWLEIIRDENVIGNIVRKKLTGEYNDLKGAYVEKMISDVLNKIEEKYGLLHFHGQVKFLGKEVDHVIPSLEEPYVMIMVSYMETTSSNQTTRANEQQAMYTKIIGDNIRFSPIERIFINIVDGAGWLARRSDLRKMHAGCHYCLNIKTLDQLEPIICKYVPNKYFNKKSFS